ncbi:MAG: TonB-dependent receptor [Bacteroidales bacterium]|nr:TonB-dependent receptor [Bacteroidales bacterium]
MKNTLFVTLFLCLAQVAVAQTSIVGRIFDAEDRSPMPFAQVAIFSTQDTSLIAGATTSDNGSFTIERVRKGKYIFRAMFIGYGTHERIIEVTDESRPLALGRISLNKGVELAGFEITETFIPVQVRGDTIEYSAEAFRPVAGSALEELLKRLPGVEIDSEGKITVGGKEISGILVEGERFFDDDPRVAARNIPADFVDRVQTFTRQSDQARFTGIDDGNEETVINLSFRPGMRKGWFGRLTAGAGYDLTSNNNDFRYSNDFNINYFRDKDQLTILGGFNNVNNQGFTDLMGSSDGGSGGGRGGNRGGGGGRGGGGPTVIMGGGSSGGFSFGAGGGITQSISPGVNFVKKFSEQLSVGGSYAYSRSDRESGQKTDQHNIMSDGDDQFYSEDRRSERLSNQHRFNSEIRYIPNEDNELIIRPSMTYGTSENQSVSDYLTRYENVFDTINYGNTLNTSENLSFSARLRADYRRRLAKPRRTISFEFDGGLRIGNSLDTNYSESYYPDRSPDMVDQEVRGKSNNYNWSTQVAYTEPLINDFTLELRYRISGDENNSQRDAFNKNDLGEFTVKDSLYSNIMANSNFTQRFEARIQKNAEKYQYSLGFGVFPAYSTSRVEGREAIERPVVNLAPQASFRYQFSRQHQLNVSYSGRTNQPSVSQLQPVLDNSDPRNIRIGNQDLKPSFNHNLSVRYNNFFQNFSSINTFLRLSMTQNQITSVSYYSYDAFDQSYPKITDVTSEMFRPGTRLIIPENVGTVSNTFGMFSYSTPLFTQKVTLSSTTSGFLNNSKSKIDSNVNVLNNLMLSENLRITYRLQDFDVSLNARFQVNDARYTLQPDQNNTYYITSGGVDFTWQIIRNKLAVSSDFNFSRMDNLSEGHNPRWNLWNAQLSYNIGKANQGQIRLRVMDILNQNKNTQRNVSETFIEDVTYHNTLQRYFLVAFTYNLNTALRSSAPQQQNARNPERRWEGGGRPPGEGGGGGPRIRVIEM